MKCNSEVHMIRKLNKTDFFWLTLLLGVLLAFQSRTLMAGAKYIPLQQLQQAQLTLEKQSAELQVLRNQVKVKSDQIKNIESGTDVEQELIEQLQSEIDELQTFTGHEDVEGQGVIIIISDGTSKLFENEDPNNLMVHDLDIRTIVDDLRYAGAEAISVNDQRIVEHITPIYCNGPTIKVNDQMCSQPFIIKAIGNKRFLEAAINAPDKYGGILRQWGLFIEVNTSMNVRIPKYGGDIQFKYLQPVKEGV